MRNLLIVQSSSKKDPKTGKKIWGTRNALRDVNFYEKPEKVKKVAEDIIAQWRAVEPETEFRIHEVPFSFFGKNI